MELPQPHCAVRVQVVKSTLTRSVTRNAGGAGVRAVSVMNAAILKVRLQLSDVVVAMGLIWLVLEEGSRAIKGIVVGRHLGAGDRNRSDGGGGGHVQGMHPSDGGVGRSFLRTAAAPQRWA